jgi:L-cystine transport system permease protein
MELNLPFLWRTFFLALQGIPVALEITILALVFSVVPAFFMALVRIYRVRILTPMVKIYVSFIRGTPIVVQILIIYSLLPSLINWFVLKTGSTYDIFSIDPVIYALVVFTIHTAAGFSELIRSAILTVDGGQMDAAAALGMKKLQAFHLVIIPQAAVSAIPNLCNLTINLFKETSLVFLMTVKDITAIAKIEASYGYNYIEAYLDIFIIYLLVCSAIQAVFYAMEKFFRKVQRKTR